MLVERKYDIKEEMDALLYFADDINISGDNSVSFSIINTSLISIVCHKSKLAGLGLHQIYLLKH